MAVNLCPDSPISLCSSPRISFSNDLDHQPPSNHVPRSDQNLLCPEPSSNHSDFDFDFDFSLPACDSGHETSPADELFSNGMIIPTHMKRRNPNPSPFLEASVGGFLPLLEPSGSPIPPSNQTQKETGEEDAGEQEEIIVTSTRASLIREEKGQSKSFWRFMRSSSLNSESSHCRKASIWSSLPLLARSNSTGSSPHTTTKQSHGKIHGGSSSQRHSSKPSSSSSSTGFHQKPPLRKGHGGLGCSPVLNVPPPYITKGTSDLLGFGSLFRNGSDKKAKKR